MFYRRKILLALLEAFGGRLAKTDCQKLMLLFCLRNEKNYYDFFPHTHGTFSILLYQDWSCLIDLGYLQRLDGFQLSDGGSYSRQIQAKDRAALQTLVAEVGDARGEDLLRKVYLEYPYYALRSEFAYKVLTEDEYRLVRIEQNNDSSFCLFTVGYEGLSIDAFLNILLANNIAVLVDVRKNPISMKYGFSKTKFSEYVRSVGLVYCHIPELGVPSELRQDLKSVVAYEKLFEYYKASILPHQEEALRKLKGLITDQRRVAITCFEADFHFCHRHKIAEYLQQEPIFDVPVVHLQKNVHIPIYKI